MKEQDANADQTRIRKPSQSTNKLPERFQVSVVIIKGYAEGMEYSVTKEYTVLGRDKEADIAVKDPLVSRRHAAIIYHDGGFVLQDLESTNGTTVNGTLIQQTDLRHRDKFRIGDTTIQFVLEDTGGGRVYEINE
jgi:pSer/pThr/pTyr-binding forkhead associated (FHA) protein